jgi:hypothetical protein
VDASSCAPAAAGFMTVVGGSDREVLVDEQQDIKTPTHDVGRTEIFSILQIYERFEIIDLLVTSYINCLFHNLIVEVVCYH